MKYEAVIGLEVHAQVRTDSKMFCSCPNRYGSEPNTNVCPVCMGYPGVLPVPNREAIRKTMIAGLLTDCTISKFSKFDRKSYFYPDMPKNYQISQYDLPFCLAGHVHISGTGFSGEPLPEKDIGITRIHLEEDVAKLTHFRGASGVDYNRAGIPLMETVSEPDMRSADEAYAYLTALKEIFVYGGVGNCDQEKGQMRCDVNISLRPVGREEFGTKVELKNLNSFRAVHRAIDYEIWRQADVLDKGGTIVQETRGWNDDRGETYLMRTKEQAHDYRYFPDPDLTPVVMTDAEIDELRRILPEMPSAKRERFVGQYGLTEYDADVLTHDRDIADYFESAAQGVKTPKNVANWIISELLRELGSDGLEGCKVKPEQLGGLVAMIEADAISGRIGKEVFAEMLATGKDAKSVVEAKGLAQVSDSGAIEKVVDETIAANSKQVQQYLDGNANVLMYLVGQTMKLSRGKANPKMVLELLKAKLDK
ncbi:MAG: Asp-tRNA(Asn)/Glu-tRNA(Gln) amidotransferase subunit GatB [Victivallaceae bacterium]|nr:Asp-tRNA(Asn)/Glu-tRNA(Gln) amidotransferase subunit GatB [Victivallaceae bacterium]